MTAFVTTSGVYLPSETPRNGLRLCHALDCDCGQTDRDLELHRALYFERNYQPPRRGW